MRFEIIIHERLNENELVKALMQQEVALVYQFQVDALTTASSPNISVRFTLVDLSEDSYPTREEAISAAEAFISDFTSP